MQQGIPDTVNSKWYNKEWLRILIHLLCMVYFSDVSDVLLQSIFKLNDDEKLSTSITISESQLVIMVKLNPMIKKKVN